MLTNSPYLLFHLFRQSGDGFEVVWVGIDVEYLSVAVNEFAGREAAYLEEI